MFNPSPHIFYPTNLHQVVPRSSDNIDQKTRLCILDILHKHLPINESLRPYARQFCILMYANVPLLFFTHVCCTRNLAAPAPSPTPFPRRSFIIEHENEELGCIAIKWCAELFRVFGRPVNPRTPSCNTNVGTMHVMLRPPQ